MNLEKRQRIFDLISAERSRQHEKFGDQSHKPDGTWALILGEEVGEWMKACLDGDKAHAKEEMIQVAAVCVQWLEIQIGADMPATSNIQPLMPSTQRSVFSMVTAILVSIANRLVRYAQSLAAWEKKK